MLSNYLGPNVLFLLMLLAITIFEVRKFHMKSSIFEEDLNEHVKGIINKRNKVAVLYLSWLMKLPIYLLIVYLDYEYYFSLDLGNMVVFLTAFSGTYFVLTLLIDALNPFHVLRKITIFKGLRDETIYKRKKTASMIMTLLHLVIVLFIITPYLYNMVS